MGSSLPTGLSSGWPRAAPRAEIQTSASLKLCLQTHIIYTQSFIDVRPAVSEPNENLYSPHNSDSSSDKINTKLYNKNTKK